MKRKFIETLEKMMGMDKDIYLIPLDVGFGVLEHIMERFPERVQNHGISEQHAVSLATGMAIEGKRPFVYSINSFLIFRALEQIRMLADMNKDQNYANVTLVGTGLEDEYSNFGMSHYAFGDEKILSTFPIKVLTPKTKDEVESKTMEAYHGEGVSYLRLSR